MYILVLDDDQYRLDIFKRNLEKRLKMDATFYVKTEKEAIDLLDKYDFFDYIFLDHDLGGHQMEWQEDNCGMNVVDWIIMNQKHKDSSIVVHSWNIPRGQEMVARLKENGYSVVHQPGAWNILG